MKKEPEPSPLDRKLTFVVLVGCLWLFGLVGALTGLPLPSSLSGWILFLVLAPVGVLLVEAAAEVALRLLSRTRFGRWASHRHVSTVRGTLILLLIAAVFVFGMWYTLAAQVSP